MVMWLFLVQYCRVHWHVFRENNSPAIIMLSINLAVPQQVLPFLHKSQSQESKDKADIVILKPCGYIKVSES